MSHLFLPPKVAQELIEERMQYAADLELVCGTDETCRRWTRELRRLDPLLKMVRAPEVGILGLPLVPGCYHVIRKNHGAPDTVTPIVDAAGGFMEPPGSLLEKIKATDLQDIKVTVARERRIAEAREAEERQKDADSARRVAIAIEHLDAATKTRISFDRSHRWTQNATATGRRGRRA